MLVDDPDPYAAAKAGVARYWANVTPEQLEERRLKAAATRAANRARDAERRRAADAQLAAKEQRRLRQRAARQGPIPPPVWRAVPGSDGVTYRFEHAPPKYLAKRAARFWAYVDQSGGPEVCWPWHGSRRFESDYGQSHWQGRPIPSHRVAWTLASGLVIPYELVVDHLCCCQWCQNPDHLQPVTGAENRRRRFHRSPEATRVRTSFDSPFEDRWYPFGRRLYDAAGNRLPDVDDRWR